jgi:hypothetical protein
MGREHAPGEGRGFVEFAGIFYLVAGALNVVAGIAALSRGDLFSAGDTLVDNVPAWAAVWIALGAAQLLVGLFVLRRTKTARAWGLGFGIAGLVVWFIGFGIRPGWALVMFVLYFIVLYALTAYREYFH